jgi:hypothetical protein
MSTEPRPCPFCGKAPARVSNGWIDEREVWPVVCQTTNCASVGHVIQLRNWNTRAVPASAVPEVSDSMLLAAMDGWWESRKAGMRTSLPSLKDMPSDCLVELRQDMRAALVAAFGVKS